MTEGKVQLADFRLSEAGSREPVLTVPSFGIDGISLDLSKRELGIGTAALTGADIRAWLAEDGSSISSRSSPQSLSRRRRLNRWLSRVRVGTVMVRRRAGRRSCQDTGGV